MTSHRVIFPDPDYWTHRKDTPVSNDPKTEAIRNCPAAVIPDNTIRTWAESLRLMVVGAPDRTLMLALHLKMPAPLGDVQCHLGREQIIELHAHLDDLLNLTDEQTEALVDRACQEDGA